MIRFSLTNLSKRIIGIKYMPLTICTSRCEASNCLAQRRLLPVERKPIQHESRYHWDISFLTSTYNGTFLPWNLYVAEHIWYDSCEGNKSDYFTSDERWTPYGPHSHPGSRAEAKCLVNLVLPTFHHLTFRAVRVCTYLSAELRRLDSLENLQCTTFIPFFLAGRIC